MGLDKIITIRLEPEKFAVFQAAAAKQGKTVSDLLRGFVNLVGCANPAIPNHDQPLAGLLAGKRKRKGDDRPLADLLKSH